MRWWVSVSRSQAGEAEHELSGRRGLTVDAPSGHVDDGEDEPGAQETEHGSADDRARVDWPLEARFTASGGGGAPSWEPRCSSGGGLLGGVSAMFAFVSVSEVGRSADARDAGACPDEGTNGQTEQQACSPTSCPPEDRQDDCSDRDGDVDAEEDEVLGVDV
jgi:hypothetical protein